MVSYLRLLRNGAAAAGISSALEEGLESELVVPHPRRRHHRGRRVIVPHRCGGEVLALVGLRHGEAGGEVGGPVAAARGREVAGVVEVGGGHRGQVAGTAA